MRLFYGIALVFLLNIQAQIPFAYVMQTPLALNFSLAGSKNKCRFATSYNNTTSKAYTENNIYASFDKSIKGTGLGYGVFYRFGSVAADSIPQLWKNSLPNYFTSKLLNLNFVHELGLAFSAKYNIKGKNDPTKVIYTLSPSLGFTYSIGSSLRHEHFVPKNYLQVHYDYLHPEGINMLDSNAAQIVSQESKSSLYKTRFGLGINSNKLLVLFNITYGIDIVNNVLNQQIHSFGRKENTELHIKNRFYALSEDIHFAYSVNINKAGTVAFTPMFGLGFNQYLNIDNFSKLEKDSVYSQNIYGKKLNDISYKHISGTFRMYKFLIGATYTSSFNKIYYGALLGLQTNKHKIVYCTRFGERLFNELSYALVF